MGQPIGKKPRGGRLKDRFNRVVCHFDLAVHMARFPTLAYALIYEARMASWVRASQLGMADPLPFKLSLRGLAKKYRCDRKTLEDRHRVLVAARVFVPAGDGSYWINKEGREWWDAENDRPLFDAEQVELIEALKRALPAETLGRGAPRGEGAWNPQGEGAPTLPAGGVEPPGGGGVEPPGEGAWNPHTRPESLEVALKGPGAGASAEFAESRREILNESLFQSETHKQTDDNSPHLIPSEDRQLIEAAGKLAETWFPLRDLGIAISRHDQHFNPKSEGHFPAAWLRPALEKLRDVPADKHTWPYLKAILRGFARAGGPPGGSPATPKARPNPHEARRAERRALIERLKAQLPSDAEAADGAR